MCLAIPGLVESIVIVDDLKMAKVNFGGIRRTACLEYTPDASAGDYVLVHVGFAISVIDEKEAKETYEILAASGEMDEFINDVDASKVGEK